MANYKTTDRKTNESTSKINIASELKKFSAPAKELLSSTRKFNINALASQDLQALYEVSKAVNSTLILDEILGIVMLKSIELLKAERGFLMLLDSNNELQFKTAHNINKKQLSKKDLQVSSTIAEGVVKTGKSIYTSDALNDDRFAKKRSVLEMNIRSAICVPLKIKNQTIGIVYLDNSSEANIFLKSDLHLFELFADMAALAIQNAQHYNELSALQHFQEAVLEETPVGIIVLSEDGILRSHNSAAQRILSMAVTSLDKKWDSIINNNFLDLLPEKERSFWVDNIKDSEEAPTEISSHMLKIDDEELILRMHFSPFANDNADLRGRIIIIEDVTDRILMEQYLVISEKMVAKGEMAAAIGHELNNYLTTIMSSAQLLPKYLNNKSMDKVTEKVDAIVDSVDRMKRFTLGLMDFSALETQKSYHKLQSVIDDVVFFVKPQHRFKHLGIEINFPDDLPGIMIDSSQIHQVLLNLLINAADAIETAKIKKGVIEISASADKDKMTLIIKDNGPGIPEVIYSRLFEPHMTSKKAGHGLGLSTSKQLVESHGGEISAENCAGGGACFTIVLPMR